MSLINCLFLCLSAVKYASTYSMNYSLIIKKYPMEKGECDANVNWFLDVSVAYGRRCKLQSEVSKLGYFF